MAPGIFDWLGSWGLLGLIYLILGLDTHSGKKSHSPFSPNKISLFEGSLITQPPSKMDFLFNPLRSVTSDLQVVLDDSVAKVQRQQVSIQSMPRGEGHVEIPGFDSYKPDGMVLIHLIPVGNERWK